MSYFRHLAIVPLCVAAALGAAIAIGPEAIRKIVARTPGNLTLLIGGWAVLLLVNVSRTPDFQVGVYSIAKFTGTALTVFFLTFGASLLPRAWARRAIIALSISVSIVTVLWVLDMATAGKVSFAVFERTVQDNYGFFWFKAAATLAALMSLILAYAAWVDGRRILAMTIIVGLIIFLACFKSRTLMASVPIAMLIAYVSLKLGRHRMRILFGSVIVITAVIVGGSGKIFSAPDVGRVIQGNSSAALSVIYRAHIWEYTINLIREKPILGWGLGSSRYLGNKKHLMDPRVGFVGEAIPSHPHNVSLQILLETGAIGFGLFLGILYLLLSSADRGFQNDQIGRFQFITIVLVIMMLWHFNYGAWSTWWLHDIALTSAMLIVARRGFIAKTDSS
ncbi:MAG: hypothetical protein O2944_09540 [Proteobacteria bacterium]|nr:hypothetical protein [Pseudomonadota bacterium]